MRPLFSFYSLLTLFVLSMLLPPGQAQAQMGVEIAAFGGYQFGGKADVRLNNIPGDLKIKSSGNFGLAVDIPVRSGAFAEILFMHQPTVLRFEPIRDGENQDLFDFSVSYFHAGTLYEMRNNGPVWPFATLTIGATWFNPHGAGIDSEWRFSGALGIGAKTLLTQQLGLRLQGHFLVPFFASGGGIFCGLGGCNVGLTAGSTILQGSVSGGLFYAF